MSVSRTNWTVVAFAFIAGAAATFYVGKVPPALPLLRSDLDMGLVTAGWVVSIFYLIIAFAAPIAGAFADRIGHRRVVLAGLALCVVAGAAGAMARSPAELLLSRIMEGFGFLAVTVCGPALMTRVARREDFSLVFGLWTAFFPVGCSMMILLAPFLIAPYGWRGLWWINAALLLVVALAFHAVTRRFADRPQERETRSIMGALARDLGTTARARGTWLIGACFGLYTFQYFTIVGWLPTILIERHGVDLTASSIASAAIVAVNAPGTLVGTYFARARLPSWIMVVGPATVLGVLGLVLFIGRPSYAVTILCSALFLFFGGMIAATLFSAVPAHAPSPRLIGTANGLVNQCMAVGSFVGPPTVAAVVAGFGGWQFAPIALGVAAVLCVSAGILLRRHERRMKAG